MTIDVNTNLYELFLQLSWLLQNEVLFYFILFIYLFFLFYFILFYNHTWHSLTIQLHGTYLQQDYKIYLRYKLI